MEILADVGLAEPIYARSAPAENMSAMGWYAGLAGPDPDLGRLISKIETWGCGYDNLNWEQASPYRSANLPQIRLEPVMKARAEELSPGAVRFHHELVGLEQRRRGRPHQEPCQRRRVYGEGPLPAWVRGRPHHSTDGRYPLRGPRRARPDRDSTCLRRPVEGRRVHWNSPLNLATPSRAQASSLSPPGAPAARAAWWRQRYARKHELATTAPFDA
jgi:FAD binding domain